MSRDKCGRFVATRRMGLSRQPDRSWEDGQASKRHAASWDSWGSPQVLLFCGLISYFFPQKTPSCAKVHFQNWPCHLVLWTTSSVTISISKYVFTYKLWPILRRNCRSMWIKLFSKTMYIGCYPFRPGTHLGPRIFRPQTHFGPEHLGPRHT